MSDIWMTMKCKVGEQGRLLRQDPGMALSLAYVFLPVLIFFFGWLRLWLALPLGVLWLAAFGSMGRYLCEERKKRSPVGIHFRPEYWIIVGVAVFAWLMFSGIGGFSYQNSDYFVRNPIYRDLVRQPWPVFFDFSSQRQAVRDVLGGGSAAFVYYFCFWLPPALLAKLFAGNELLANIFLLAWAYLGVMLVLYQIHRRLKRHFWAAPVIFICFSGLDMLGYWLLKGRFAFGAHLEWWCTYFQYSSHTTVLYWVFNQAIPIWLLTALLLNMRGNKTTAGLCSLAFAYSPFATFGMVPLAVYSIFRRGQSFKKALAWENALLPLAMLLVFGSFYLSNAGSVSLQGWIFQFYPWKKWLPAYLLFLLLEVGVYAWILRKCLRKYAYLWVALASLALIPLYKMTGANDFAMRASLPALLILSVCLTRYALTCRADYGKWAALALSAALTLGAVTPLCEIYRSVVFTARQGANPVETVYSFQAFATDNENTLLLCRRQFFAYGYEKSFFFQCLGKYPGKGK